MLTLFCRQRKESSNISSSPPPCSGTTGGPSSCHPAIDVDASNYHQASFPKTIHWGGQTGLPGQLHPDDCQIGNVAISFGQPAPSPPGSPIFTFTRTTSLVRIMINSPHHKPPENTHDCKFTIAVFFDAQVANSFPVFGDRKRMKIQCEGRMWDERATHSRRIDEMPQFGRPSSAPVTRQCRKPRILGSRMMGDWKVMPTGFEAERPRLATMPTHPRIYKPPFPVAM
jgi:hypothetical protein